MGEVCRQSLGLQRQKGLQDRTGRAVEMLSGNLGPSRKRHCRSRQCWKVNRSPGKIEEMGFGVTSFVIKC